MGLLYNTLNTVYFIVDGASHVSIRCNHKRPCQDDYSQHSMTPPTYGNANIIIYHDSKFSMQPSINGQLLDYVQ